MKQICIVVFMSVAFLSALTLSSQNLVATDYTFSSYQGAFVPLSSPTILATTAFDDQSFLVGNLPTFVFNGVSYNQLTVHCNGSIAVGAIGNVGTSYMPISNNNNSAGVIAPLGRDLQGATTNSTLSWALDGDQIVVQWFDVKRFGSTNESLSFQVRIHTISNTILFVYGDFTNLVANSGDPQVGLRGATNMDFNNRSVTINENWVNSEAGTMNNASCRLNPTAPATSPVSGLVYAFSPCQGILGCIDVEACNYDPNATCDSGQCTYCGCVQSNCGCMDPEACNFDEMAAQDNGGCDYACIGCTNEAAFNYNPLATNDDGTCILEGSGWSCVAPINLGCQSISVLGTTTEVLNNNDVTVIPSGCGTSTTPSLWYIYTAPFSSTLTISTDHPATDFDSFLYIYSGECGALECVGYNDDGGGALTSLLSITAIEGQTYFVRVGGFGNQTGNFGLTFDCGGGCLDPGACNYDANAPFDNGNCTYGDDCYGCIDEDATNFDPIAVYDNNTCLYSTEIVVYYDLNGDGDRDWNEPGMANWPVYVGGLQATLFTNGSGLIDMPMPASPFVLELINTSENWISSTPSTQMIDIPSNVSAQFGLIPDTGEAFHISGPYDGFWDIIHCNNGMEDGVYLINTGGVPLNGTITLVCDEMFTPEADDFPTITPDVTGPGFAQWNFVDFLPGQNALFSFHIDGPGVDVIGDEFLFIYDVVLYGEDGSEYFNTEYVNDRFVACAYDPNDITATPVGYAEPHYTLPTERIEYRVRFQNTGNLPAEDVVIIDELDPTLFNVGTFQPMYGSDSFTTCLHDDGTLDFIFNDIMLPDSASDEEGSHGFVVFSVELQPGLAPGAVINNYADIYFELNPAITTNTVFHTIFDCQSFVVPSLDENMCVNEVITFDNSQNYVETYTWTVDGDMVSETALLELNGLNLGEHVIDWSVDNPLCGASESFVIHMHAAPSLELEENTSVCMGSEVVLNAQSEGTVIWNGELINGSIVMVNESVSFTANAINAMGCTTSGDWMVEALTGPVAEIVIGEEELSVTTGDAWQWYLNGQVIEGATLNVLAPDMEGSYSVLVTNETGCTTLSASVQVSSVFGVASGEMAIYPSPIVDVSTLVLPAGVYDVQLLDARGRVVKAYDSQQNRMEIRSNELSSGIYFVQLKNETNTFTMKTIIE